ncbi:ABC transporter permease subunit [Candidatus Sumerlaeota bacterium]|nr:ABC transporter permease subunit [Candidatus Sumerlaeota bacterium]
MPSLPSLSPIFTKELRTTLRSNKSVLFLFLILALISGVFMLFWMEQSELTMSLGGRAQFSRTIFLFIASCQFLALSLISPMMTATVITGERESKTLDLLFCTGISRMHILLAKWISAIAYQLILLVCMLPILALIFQLGGVGLDEYLAAALLIAQAVVTYGMLGAAVSSRFRRTTSSLMMSLFLVLG